MIDFVICFASILLLQIITPWWWWILIVPFVLGIIRAKSGWYGFLIGMSGSGLLWFVSSIYYYFSDSQIIAHRVAEMFALGSPFLLILISGFMAAVAGGFAGSSGHAIRKAIFEKP